LKKIAKNNLSFIITLVIVIALRLFVFSPVYIDGVSMYPTLDDNDFVILNLLDKSIERFDVVVIDKDYSGKDLIKRVIGLPGDRIYCNENQIFINGELLVEEFLSEGSYTEDFSEVVVGKGSYFVIGDNRSNSLDSRLHGVVEHEYIRGTVKFVFFPFKRIGFLK